MKCSVSNPFYGVTIAITRDRIWNNKIADQIAISTFILMLP